MMIKNRVDDDFVLYYILGPSPSLAALPLVSSNNPLVIFSSSSVSGFEALYRISLLTACYS